MKNDSIQLNDEELKNVNGGNGDNSPSIVAAMEIIDICDKIGDDTPESRQIKTLTQLFHQLDPSATDYYTTQAIICLKNNGII